MYLQSDFVVPLGQIHDVICEANWLTGPLLMSSMPSSQCPPT